MTSEDFSKLILSDQPRAKEYFIKLVEDEVDDEHTIRLWMAAMESGQCVKDITYGDWMLERKFSNMIRHLFLRQHKRWAK